MLAGHAPQRDQREGRKGKVCDIAVGWTVGCMKGVSRGRCFKGRVALGLGGPKGRAGESAFALKAQGSHWKGTRIDCFSQVTSAK